MIGEAIFLQIILHTWHQMRDNHAIRTLKKCLWVNENKVGDSKLHGMYRTLYVLVSTRIWINYQIRWNLCTEIKTHNVNSKLFRFVYTWHTSLLSFKCRTTAQTTALCLDLCANTHISFLFIYLIIITFFIHILDAYYIYKQEVLWGKKKKKVKQINV